MVGEITTSPLTFVHAERVVRSDCELMLNVAEVQAAFAEEVVVLCAETAAMATKDDRRNESIVFLEMDGGTLNDRQIRKGSPCTLR